VELGYGAFEKSENGRAFASKGEGPQRRKAILLKIWETQKRVGEKVRGTLLSRAHETANRWPGFVKRKTNLRKKNATENHPKHLPKGEGAFLGDIDNEKKKDSASRTEGGGGGKVGKWMEEINLSVRSLGREGKPLRN